MTENYPDNVYKLVDAVGASFHSAKTDEEVSAAWDHFQALEGFVERTWPSDKHLIDDVRRLKSGLSQFSRDRRERMPSPYTGWSVQLSSIRSKVGPQFGADGYPIKRR